MDQSSTSNLFQKPILKNILEGLSEMFTFLFHNVLNYFLMLCVMLFNGYLFIAVCLGMAVGYFLFGHLSMKTNMENLQAIQTKIICSARCAESGENINEKHTLRDVMWDRNVNTLLLCRTFPSQSLVTYRNEQNISLHLIPFQTFLLIFFTI